MVATRRDRAQRHACRAQANNPPTISENRHRGRRLDLKIAESAATASLQPAGRTRATGEPASRSPFHWLSALSPLAFNAIVAIAWLVGAIVALCFRGSMLMAGF